MSAFNYFSYYLGSLEEYNSVDELHKLLLQPPCRTYWKLRHQIRMAASRLA